jgi:hypothetical protein
MVLDAIGSRDAKAKNLSPPNLIDVTYLRELESSCSSISFIKIPTRRIKGKASAV